MDSTLIDIDEDNFSREYFRLLNKLYFPEFSSKTFVTSLVEITRNVMLSEIPEELTINTFIREMSQSFNTSPENVYEKINSYYDNEYDQLEKYISVNNDAIKAIEAALAKDLQIVVATTPIFPEKAILKRLTWGKIDEYDFSYITHAENMHFSKPRKEYYTELLDILRIKPRNCIMVGNEFVADIVAPTQLGMETFYCPRDDINDKPFTSAELNRFNKIQPTYHGTLANFAELLDNGFEL